MPVWGNASERFGTGKMLSLSDFLMPAIPALWLFNQPVPYLVVIQLYSGFVWAGFEISSFNFIFDTTTPHKRATWVAYYDVVNGAVILAGALAGSLIARSNYLFWSRYLLVFGHSTLLRYRTSLFFIPRPKEARTVEAILYPRLFLKIISSMPIMGLIYSLISFRKQTRTPSLSSVDNQA